jgi:hypothetical protein
MLLITDRARFEGRRLAGHATVAALALAYTIWTVAGSGYEVVYKGFLLLLLGIPVYLWMKYRSARHAVGTPLVGDRRIVMPGDVDAAIADVISDEHRKVSEAGGTHKAATS